MKDKKGVQGYVSWDMNGQTGKIWEVDSRI